MLAETLGDHESVTDGPKTLIPEPDKPIDWDAPATELLEITSEPFVKTASDGAKLIVRVADCAGARVAGVVRPPRERRC